MKFQFYDRVQRIGFIIKTRPPSSALRCSIKLCVFVCVCVGSGALTKNDSILLLQSIKSPFSCPQQYRLYTMPVVHQEHFNQTHIQCEVRHCVLVYWVAGGVCCLMLLFAPFYRASNLHRISLSVDLTLFCGSSENQYLVSESATKSMVRLQAIQQVSAYRAESLTEGVNWVRIDSTL